MLLFVCFAFQKGTKSPVLSLLPTSRHAHTGPLYKERIIKGELGKAHQDPTLWPLCDSCLHGVLNPDFGWASRSLFSKPLCWAKMCTAKLTPETEVGEDTKRRIFWQMLCLCPTFLQVARKAHSQANCHLFLSLFQNSVLGTFSSIPHPMQACHRLSSVLPWSEFSEGSPELGNGWEASSSVSLTFFI